MFHYLNAPQAARYIKFTILSFFNLPCLRVEVYRDKGKESTHLPGEEINRSETYSNIIMISFFPYIPYKGVKEWRTDLEQINVGSSCILSHPGREKKGP